MMSAVLSYLVNAAWQAPVIVLLALSCGRWGRLAPSGLHRLYVAALCAAVGIPALAPHAGELRDWLGPAAQAGPSTAAVASTSSGILAASSPPEVTGLTVGAPAASIALAIAGAFFAAGLVRLARGLVSTGQLLRTAQPTVLDADLDRRLTGFCVSRNIARPMVKISSNVDCPVVAGVLTPTVVVPPGYFEADRDQVVAGLFHECAHVVRRDFPINVALEILMLPQSWNPVIHLLKGAIGRARESACDSIASDEIGSRSSYALSLVGLASSAMQQRDHGPALALIRVGELERRVSRLLQPTIRASLSRRAFPSLAVALIIAAVPFMHVEAAVEAGGKPAQPSSVAQPAGPQQVPDKITATASTHIPATPRSDRRAALRQRRRIADNHARTVKLTDAGKSGYTHEWINASGRHYHVITDDPRDIPPDERVRLEGRIDHALADADRARTYLDSPQFRSLQQRLASGDLQTQIRRATAQLNDTRTQMAIRQARVFARSDVARRLEELSNKLGTTEFTVPDASPSVNIKPPHQPLGSPALSRSQD